MGQNVTWLSHPLSANTSAYGGGEGMQIQSVSKIANGDSSNTSRFVLPNHLGTHIDAPRHFFDSGATLTDYAADFWFFDAPVLVDVAVENGYLISFEDVEALLSPETDLLLIRTGFEAFRGTLRYWKHNPGLEPEFGMWIRKHFPKIRAVGMDLISVTSRHHREQGRKAHQALLDPDKYGNPVLPIEDMALGHVKQILTKVVVSPLRINNIDGGPCTIFGIGEFVK